MLLGSLYSLRAAEMHSQGDLVGEFYCTCCNREGQLPETKPQLRMCGGEHSSAGRYQLIVGPDGLLVTHIVAGFHPTNLISRVQFNTSTKHADHRHQDTTMPLGWNPNNSKNRHILGVRKFDGDILCASFTKLSNAAKDARDLAVETIGARQLVDEWMLHGKIGRLISLACFSDKLRHMIIGKRGLEDGKVKIGNFTYTGIPIEVPEGHEGFGWPTVVKNDRKLWPQSQINRFWKGD
jgi:hypothetical protein